MHINFSPFPYLESDRLYLRPIAEDDVQEVFALRSDPATMQYIPRPLAKTKQDALDHIRMIHADLKTNNAINWAISLKGENRLIGMICLLRMQVEHYRTEVGYILHPSFHRKGIMSEALKQVLRYAFQELYFHAVEAVIDPNNKASEELLVKHHFRKEAYYKEKFFYNNRFMDTAVYSLLARDYPYTS